MPHGRPQQQRRSGLAALFLFLLCFCSTSIPTIDGKKGGRAASDGAAVGLHADVPHLEVKGLRRGGGRRRGRRQGGGRADGARGAVPVRELVLHGPRGAAQRDRARGHAGGDSPAAAAAEPPALLLQRRVHPAAVQLLSAHAVRVRRGGLRRALPGGGPRDGRARAARGRLRVDGDRRGQHFFRDEGRLAAVHGRHLARVQQDLRPRAHLRRRLLRGVVLLHGVGRRGRSAPARREVPRREPPRPGLPAALAADGLARRRPAAPLVRQPQPLALDAVRAEDRPAAHAQPLDVRIHPGALLFIIIIFFLLLFYFCRRCCFPSVVRVSFKKNGISNDMPHQNCIHPRCTSSCARGRRTVASR
jgi:hypothetical protein